LGANNQATGAGLVEPLITKAILNDLRDKENSLMKRDLEFSHELRALQQT
jgi:hypothetical protein